MFYNRITVLCLLLMALSSVSCCVARNGNAVKSEKKTDLKAEQLDEVSVAPLQSLIEKSRNGDIIVKQRYDLQGRELVLSNGSTLVFKGGSFSNGTIIGDNTRIRYNGGAIFDNVRIRGTWAVKNITTDMFKDLNYVNSLADVLGLTNGNVDNHVLVKDYGFEYPVKVSSIGVNEAPLKVKSNTDIQLDGTISLLGNNLFQYRIMVMQDCKNVKISGKGSIKGDRENHDYSVDDEHKAWKTHEWGHGIKISNCQDIEISGISVKDCTGDSFSIGENSESIILHGVTAEGSRRQGVTIAVASDVTIDKCFFRNIGKENGTAPGAAIDVEPDNIECEIKNILIRDCEIKNCSNGIVSYSKGYGTTWTENIAGESVVKRDGRHYVNITVESCSICGVHDAFSLIGWEKGEIKNCQVSDAYLFLRDPNNFLIKGNEIDCEYLIPHKKFVENCEINNNKLTLRNNAELVLKKSTWNNNNVSNQTKVKVRVGDL